MSKDDRNKQLHRMEYYLTKIELGHYRSRREEMIAAVASILSGALLGLILLATLISSIWLNSAWFNDGAFKPVLLFAMIVFFTVCLQRFARAGAWLALVMASRFGLLNGPSWKDSFTNEFKAYSPLDANNYEALKAERDSSGQIPLPRMKEWLEHELSAALKC